MAYCLDTNTIVFCLRGKSAKVMQRLHATPASELCVPMQVVAELRVGATKSAKPTENAAKVNSFIKPYVVLWPDESTTDHYVSIRCALEAKGQCISEADLWIAATARSRGDVVVTNNVDELRRVPGLVVEDWTV